MTVTSSAAASKAIRLNYSRPIDFHKTSTDPTIDSLVDNLFAQMERAGLTSKRYADELKLHIKAITLDLCAAYRTDPRQYLAYSRNKNDYSKKTKSGSRYIPQFISHSHTTNFIDFLHSKGYIEHDKGFFKSSNTSRSRLSRMKAKANFIKLRKIRLYMIDRDVNEETIILRDADKKDIDYTDDAETCKMRENLQKINRVIDKHLIALDMNDDVWKKFYQDLRKGNRRTVDFTRKRLCRIFNNGLFEQGGRFYRAWWQGIPRGYRKYIAINHKDTVELDYSGLHINMLYAKKGHPLPTSDPYTLPTYGGGDDVRTFLKKILQAFINAPTRESAKKAIRKSVNMREIEQPKSVTSLDDILDEFEEKHDPIRTYFCSAAGIDLQYIDSQMAEAVMLHYAKHNRVVLPVHDSFIMITSMQEELEATMNEAFYQKYDMDIKIKLEATVREEEKKESGRFRKERGITSPFVTDEEFRHYVETRKKSDSLHAELSKPSPYVLEEDEDSTWPPVE